MNKKPVIGVLPRLNEAGPDLISMQESYMHAIEAAGGIPIIIPPLSNPEDIAQIARLYDGFAFTGGVDVPPEWYGEERMPETDPAVPARDRMESALIKEAMALDLPILGICRGFQVINVVLGGSLYQHLPVQLEGALAHRREEQDRYAQHEVTLVQDAPLFSLLGQEVISVNSWHHQGVRTLAPSLRPMAFSSDGLIEAFYAPDYRFIRAMQWHPEDLCPDDANSRAIFRSFIDACKHCD